jgi:hypothetical protein
MLLLIGLIFFGGIAWYVESLAAKREMGKFGTYAYTCDEHVAFTMTPSSDLNSINIAPTSADAAYPPAETLARVSSVTAGVRYEGPDVVFTGRGERVTLGEGNSAINCVPVQNPDLAPFNFGD